MLTCLRIIHNVQGGKPSMKPCIEDELIVEYVL